MNIVTKQYKEFVVSLMLLLTLSSYLQGMPTSAQQVGQSFVTLLPPRSIHGEIVFS